MEYIFEIGDIVIVKDDIETGHYYDSYDGSCFYAPEMGVYQGREYQVVNRHLHWGYPVYNLDGIDTKINGLKHWGWIDSWLQLAHQTNISFDPSTVEDLL